MSKATGNNNGGMSKARTKKYIDRLNAIAEYLRSTPKSDLLADHAIAKKFTTADDSVLRARYMVEHNCPAETAIAAIHLRSTKKNKIDHTTWAHESMQGETSLQTLMRSWRAA